MVIQSISFIIIILDYQVEIIKHNYKSHMNIVKWHFYKMTAANKHHPYRGCHGDSKQYTPYKGNNLTTWHTWVTKAPRMIIVHDDYQRVEPGSAYPSAGLPRDISTGIRGWPPHYPSVHPLSTVGCRPTQRPSKLLSLRDPINLVCAST
jgi:hypothetical protein